MIKIVTLFLIFIAVMAMFGRLRLPKIGKFGRRQDAVCKTCGRPRIGKGPCPTCKGKG
ncbi:MAG: hypothetical protein AAGM21_13535 [Pseudomonadota bacterium]